MVKQLRLPTFFITLSCADLSWNELISIISTLESKTLNEERINSLDCFPCCSHLNLNREPTIPSSSLASSCVQM